MLKITKIIQVLSFIEKISRSKGIEVGSNINREPIAMEKRCDNSRTGESFTFTNLHLNC